ncbi:MAG: transcriptional regulator GcvA [Hyphomicrobiales bacterium]|nr:transcriptional regulator GcvA [Hyphomicrobiales bacterium]MCP5370319.1 transcriptional regulator GcvA [Hyphomicrobiales bacterium]
MARRLPPLNAVRAFEAAARHLSFSRAADELNVTPAAVSHQVKGLEEFLGVTLFRRVNRAVLLTDAAQVLLPGLSDGLDRLAAAFERLRASQQSGELTVTSGPAFAAKWLIPRLEDFQAHHPEISVRVSASLEVVDLRAGIADVAIRFGSGDYPGLRADRLFAESLQPMCAPGLLGDHPPLEALRRVTLLHDETARFDPSAPTWREWLKAAGIDGVDAQRGPRFSNAELALQAAIDGVGVVLGRTRLASRDLAAGRLVAPFALSLPLLPYFWLVCPEETADQPRIKAFRAWVLAQVELENSEAGYDAPAGITPAPRRR